MPFWQAGRNCVPKSSGAGDVAWPNRFSPKLCNLLARQCLRAGEAGEGVAATLALKDLIFRAQQVTEVSYLTYPVVRRKSVHSMWTLAVKDLILRAQWVTVVSCLTYPVMRRRFVLSLWTLAVKDLIVRAGGVTVVNCMTYPVVRR